MKHSTFLSFFEHCFKFVVRFIRQDSEQFLPVIAGIRYNDFDGNKVAYFLRNLFEDAKKYDSELAVLAEFGRELSPVLYLTLSRDRYIELDIRNRVSQLNASEISEERILSDRHDDPQIRVRVWWD